MKKFVKKENGVTIITITLMVIVITIIISVLAFYARNSIQMEQFGNMRADIEEIENKAQMYYIENGVLPIDQKTKKTRGQMKGDDEFFNQNDGDTYYLVNTDFIGVTKVYDTQYYINEATHTVYAENTLEVGKKNYPRPKEVFDKLHVESKTPSWEDECFEAPSDMFTYDDSGYITGVDKEFCDKHRNDPAYSKYFTDSINWKNIIIPAYQSNGKPIIGIRKNAFTGVNLNGGALKIPGTVKDVESTILGGGSNPKEIFINAKIIDVNAFRGAGFQQVTKITIGPSCQMPDGASCGNGLFSMAVNAKELVIGTTCLGAYAFSNCKNLSTITIDAPIEIIPEGCFMNNSNANSTMKIDLPSSLRRIEKRAFANGAIAELIMPENLEYIGEEAFASVNWGQPRLNKIDFNGNTKITEIQPRTFKGCSSLRSVTLGAEVKVIGESAFESCQNNLSTLICNDKLERIEQSAFRYCNGFQNGSVKFNSGLKYIGHFAFGNTNLRNKQIPSGTQCESDAF